MKKMLMAILLALNSFSAEAQVQLQQFPFPGQALGNADGSLLNRMVNAINKLQGTTGTTSPSIVNKNNTTGTVTTPLAGTDLQVLGANATVARIELDSFGAVPLMSTSRRNGTLASPTAILSADQLGGFNFHGASTTALIYGPAASYRAYATENWSSTAGGSKLVLSTTPNTTQTLTDAVTIGQDQSITVVGNSSLANGNMTQNASTGALAITGATTITSSSALALTVGRQGGTNPALRVDANTASSLTGLRLTAAGTGAGFAVAVVETGGTNNNLTIDAMGSGTLTLNGTATGAITLARATTITGSVTANGAANSITGALTSFGSTTPAHIATAQTTAPALTSCGTGSPVITGTDTAGIVTLGTNATGCVITFNVAYTGTPYCVVSWIATPLASQSYVTSNVAITLTQTSTSGNKVQYICMATSGG